ncbi:9897_t:CDS:2 [Entrophospora sp. SA101]|nr:12134_t:CDS:2 [Entrophospora sp. SA101]CAJ0630469.1 10620_t:CDS:2 [Entrophospora sp. SA101]CAJ0630471.1 10622_t:CDS:2 [Entrophospora sp. SA101]CAJ0755496.1 9897_t:CDS:2 [Entrophospora sp. SA101]CAJ0826945.1 19548_t:CDS:2 [Entrophospora sp. SA101]
MTNSHNNILLLSPTSFIINSTIATNVNNRNKISSSNYSSNDKTQYFDTSTFVQKLEAEGFTRQQSEAIMKSMSEVLDESMNNLIKNLVTKAEQEKTIYKSKVDFAQLKSEIQMLEKNDFQMLKTDNERIISEVEKLNQKLTESIRHTQANAKLELNLEKGRIRDGASTLELKIKETDSKIDGEIGKLKTQMESIRFQILQYILGTLTGAGALILAYLRMLR